MSYNTVKNQSEEMVKRIIEYIHVSDLDDKKSRELLMEIAASFVTASSITLDDKLSDRDELMKNINWLMYACFKALNDVYSGNCSFEVTGDNGRFN